MSAEESGLSVMPSFQSAELVDPSMFDDMVRSAFLPRLKVLAVTSDLAVEGKAPAGNLLLERGKDEWVDLGKRLEVYPLCYRFLALKFDENNKVEMQSFDPKSPEFQQIRAEAQEKDSGCAFGPQFLLWVPSLKEFVTFLFGSISFRPESRKMNACLGTPDVPGCMATFTTKLASNGKNKWFVPVIAKSSATGLPMFDPAKGMAMAAAYQAAKIATQSDPEPEGANATADGSERPQ